MSYLLNPLKIHRLELKNRLVMPPMATMKAKQDGSVSSELLEYYAEKSQGGYLSLIIIEHSYILQEGRAHTGQLSVSRDSDVEGLSGLAEVIHRSGSKCIMQINHAGGNTTAEAAGSTPRGPSAVQYPGRDVAPAELTAYEISGIIKAFADAAARVKKAGFDGVEIHSAHGYLLSQFLSPLTNKRTDAYGGDLNRRLLMHLKVIDAVRSAVGDDFPVFLRLGACDYIEGGVTPEDGIIAAREFEKAGLDALDVSGGLCGFNVASLSGQGYFAPLTQAIKKAVGIPVMLTGGITQAQAAETLLADGKADLIGVGRAILNDSAWARQAVESLR